MKRILTTFGGKAYDETTRLIVEHGKRFGADDVLVFDDKWLLTMPFCAANKWLWDEQPRYYNAGWIENPVRFGFGWCSWKAYVIQQAMAQLDPGDVLIYTDADTYPIADLRPIFDYAAAHGVMLFEEQGCTNKMWTKRDCFVAMSCDVPMCHQQTMACGRFQAFKVPHYGGTILPYWDAYSVSPLCQLWDKSTVMEDYPEFRRHSCEQSVLSNLAYRYGIPLHRTPDQNGSGPKDAELYPQLFRQEYCTGNRDDHSGSRYRTCL